MRQSSGLRKKIAERNRESRKTGMIGDGEADTKYREITMVFELLKALTADKNTSHKRWLYQLEKD